MVNNLTLGPVQVWSNDISSINAALQELLERIDSIKGLRGRSTLYDRTRVDSPTEDTDAVDLQSLVTQEIRWRVPFVAPSGGNRLLSYQPGTTYVEVSSLLRNQVDFTDLTSPQARMLVSVFGTETGSSKGIAMTTSSGTVLAEVTWDGATESLQSGTFTNITETTDQQVQLRVKGSSATESLVIQYAMVEFKGVIQTVST